MPNFTWDSFHGEENVGFRFDLQHIGSGADTGIYTTRLERKTK